MSRYVAAAKPAVVTGPDPAALVLFPGQSSQRIGMARTAVLTSRQAADFFDEAGRAIRRDLRELCWHTPADVLTRTENVQPAIVAAALAHWIAAQDGGSVIPDGGDVFAGHSLGSLAAAAAAGYLDPVTAVRLAARRGQIMAAAPPGGTMLEVFTEQEMDPERQRQRGLELAERYGVDLAAVNGPTEIALAGSLAGIKRAADDLADRAVAVPVSNAFHSRFMSPVAGDWAQALDSAGLAAQGGRYLGCTTATPTTRGADVMRDLKQCLEHPVLWHSVMTATRAVPRVVIVGPSRVLLRLARPYLDGRAMRVLDDDRDGSAVAPS